MEIDTAWMLVLEFLFLALLGTIYYLYQRRKILYQFKAEVKEKLRDLAKSRPEILTSSQVDTMFEKGDFDELIQKIDASNLDDDFAQELKLNLEEMNKYF